MDFLKSSEDLKKSGAGLLDLMLRTRYHTFDAANVTLFSRICHRSEMTQLTKPRAMSIVRLRISEQLNQSEFCGKNRRTENLYGSLMKLESQSKAVYEGLAKVINKQLKKTKSVAWEALQYSTGELDNDDQVLEFLLKLDDDHPLVVLLSEHSKSVDNQLSKQRAFHAFLLLDKPSEANTVFSAINLEKAKWGKDQQTDWAKLESLLSRASTSSRSAGEIVKNDQNELRDDDVQSRHVLIEHAVEALNKDNPAQELLIQVLGTSGSTRKDSRHLIDLLFPPELESQASDEEMPKTLDAVFKLAHNLNGPLPQLDTMCVLRDVAICLSIPRKYRFEAIRQYKQELKIRHLPTADIGISKQILCRALKLISKPKKQHVSSTELQLRFVNSKVSGERILDVDAKDLMSLAKTQLLANTQEPAGASLSSMDFYSHFSQGLAKALRIPYNESDQNTPPTYHGFINERLRLFDSVGIKVCVFTSLERTKDELELVRDWFKLIEIVKVKEENPLLFGTLRTTIDTVNGLLDDRFSSGGTTDII